VDKSAKEFYGDSYDAIKKRLDWLATA